MSVTEQLRSAPCGFRDNFGVKEVIINQDRWEAEVQRIAALEAENGSLREFVAAHDKHEAFRETVATDGYELWIAEWEHLKREATNARNRLAAEHGLPLPGAGEGA